MKKVNKSKERRRKAKKEVAKAKSRHMTSCMRGWREKYIVTTGETEITSWKGCMYNRHE